MPRRIRRSGPHRRKSNTANRRKFRTLAALLDAQPRGLVKIENHRLLWDHFMASEKLQKLRISPLCYRLLNEARIDPENLKDFYRTYKLPEDPFFPLFLKIKRDWYEQRELWKQERENSILLRVKELPEHRRRALRILAEYEEKNHPAGDHPIWENQLFPKSKKRAEEFHRLNENQWHEIWRRHLTRLSWRYRNIPPLTDEDGEPTYSGKLLAALVLRCRKVEKKEIKENFRSLSKEFHPDRGGNSESFHRIKSARDTLLKRR